MDRIDLHTHSTFSDGTFTPAELMRHAAGKGLRAVALTDHDTVAGLPEAEEAARQEGVELICGVELAALYEGVEIHLLGLMIDRQNGPLLRALEDLARHRERRNEKMLERLKEVGAGVSRESLYNHTGRNLITRAHFAHALVMAGYCDTIPEAFSKYLSPGRPGYVKRSTIGADEAIGLIHGASGVVSLAHPMLYKMSRAAIESMVARLKEAGLDALEAIYSTNTPEDDAFLRGLAKKYRLKLTGGSDFHGLNKPGIELGTGKGRLFIPYTILMDLQQL